MLMVKLENIPNGNLSKRKVVNTLLVKETKQDNFKDFSYTLYDENNVIVKVGSMNGVYDTDSHQYKPMQLVNFILDQIYKPV